MTSAEDEGARADETEDPLAAPSDRGLALLVRAVLVIVLPLAFVVLTVEWILS